MLEGLVPHRLVDPPTLSIYKLETTPLLAISFKLDPNMVSDLGFGYLLHGPSFYSTCHRRHCCYLHVHHGCKCGGVLEGVVTHRLVEPLKLSIYNPETTPPITN